ncbi:MAG: hypothetical protein PHC53_02520 [Patescibacteria group bacterium]|nr:hypothetical protein [Patescibacteria group bacterium]
MEYNEESQHACLGCGRPVDIDGDCLSCEKLDAEIAREKALEEGAEED